MSEPIQVEGNLYQLYIYPKGHRDGKDTHISVGLKATWLPSSEQDNLINVSFSISILNSNDRDQNVEKQAQYNFEKQTENETIPSISLLIDKFYAFDQLQQKGFIYPDGSLRFEFSVKKN